jgi:UDP-N-acetylglucosamine 4-epimerase
MTAYVPLLRALIAAPRTWLVTCVAGFIGSNLLETLLAIDQRVIGLDNFATGHPRNLDEVRRRVTPAQWARFCFIEGDVRNPDDGRRACADVDHVLHQAGPGAVAHGPAAPISPAAAGADGLHNMLLAARDAKVASFVYAADSSARDEHSALPGAAEHLAKPPAPDTAAPGATGRHAGLRTRTHRAGTIGLRYCNVFGRRQDPASAHATVIPGWTAAMIRGDDVIIDGDGETSHDFCFAANAVQANLLAATATDPAALNQVYDVAAGDRSTLNQLFHALRQALAERGIHHTGDLVYRDFRAGDAPRPPADITTARRLLGYAPSHTLPAGLRAAVPWYLRLATHGSGERRAATRRAGRPAPDGHPPAPPPTTP